MPINLVRQISLFLLLLNASTLAYESYLHGLDGAEFSPRLMRQELDPQMSCKGCQQVMELAKQNLPNAATIGRPALIAAITAACELYAAGVPILIPLCPIMATELGNGVADEITKDSKQISPRKNCEQMGLCPKC